MDCFNRFPIDRVNSDALTEASYWGRISWTQLLTVGAQLHIRQRNLLTALRTCKGGRLQAMEAANRDTIAIGVLNQYLHKEVPYWMAEDARAYFTHCLEQA